MPNQPETDDKRQLWLAILCFLAWIVVASQLFSTLKEGRMLEELSSQGITGDFPLLMVGVSVALLATALRSFFLYFRSRKDNNGTDV